MSNDSQDDSIFKALGHRRCREMLDALKDSPMTTRFGDIDRCTVMQHLKVLEDAELIIVRRAGRERWNHLNPLPIRDIHERWIGPYAAYAVEKLADLRKRFEG
jgi:DNA-binding transcriptional ArsR family regulator